MKIQKVKISEINPAPYNPRIDLKPGDSDFENLKKSLSTFGLVEPLVWNKRTGTLVGGHQRLMILIESGFKEVEVSVVDLNLEQEKALNLALNKIQGDWDYDKLALVVEELTKIPDFDIGITGFDLPEISEILDKAEEVKEDDFNLERALNNIDKAVTQQGDLIILGRHRLLCGDSSKPDDVRRLIGDAKVNLIFSDPPYNVNYYGGNRPNPKGRPKPSREWERIYNDNLTQEKYEAWLGNDKYFHELLYATLTAWGMNRSGGKGPILKDFNAFQTSLNRLSNLTSLEQLRNVRIENLSIKHVPLVKDIFEALGDDGKCKIMASRPLVVASSKLLHHLIPDLFPPMDRQYTEYAMRRFSGKYKIKGSLESFENFRQILEFFHDAVVKVTPEYIVDTWITHKQAEYTMNTSIPKVLDNAIVSYAWLLYNSMVAIIQPADN